MLQKNRMPFKRDFLLQGVSMAIIRGNAFSISQLHSGEFHLIH